MSSQTLDYGLAARQLLRAVRDSRSQLAFARRLGYRGNPIADWEAGRRMPTARRTLLACVTTGIDVAGAFARFHAARAPELEGRAGIARWLNDVRGKTSLAELAQQSAYSRHQISRWFSGHAEPRLHELLCLVEAMTGRVSDLVAELVPIDRVQCLQAVHARREAARKLAYEEPWTEAILRVLEASAYKALAKHQPGFVARYLGIDLATETRCLEKLRAAGLVHSAGTRYQTLGSLTVDTRSVAALKAHWTRTALARVAAPASEDVFSYNVFAASDADLARIRDLLRATYREIRAIVSASANDERVALLNLQLLHWPA